MTTMTQDWGNPSKNVTDHKGIKFAYSYSQALGQYRVVVRYHDIAVTQYLTAHKEPDEKPANVDHNEIIGSFQKLEQTVLKTMIAKKAKNKINQLKP